MVDIIKGCILCMTTLAFAAVLVHAGPPKMTEAQRALYDARKSLLAVLVQCVGVVLSLRERDSRKGGCDFFVSPQGRDTDYGTDYTHALLTLGCALDPTCNDGIQSGVGSHCYTRLTAGRCVHACWHVPRHDNDCPPAWC